MPAAPESILLDTAREVDVLSIERELAGLWGTGEGGDATEGAPIRACSLNLIVVTDRRERLEAIEQLIDDVTLEHPARIFLVMKDVTMPALKARVSVRCTMPDSGGSQVCCEEIMLSAGPGDLSKVPNVIASLLVPDVPSVLVWKMSLAGSEQFLRAFARLSDRVIIDSSEEPEPFGMLRSWNAFMHEPDHGALGGDLAWTHLTPWRSAIAHVFDPPAMREHLDTIEGVDVRYSFSTAPPHNGVSQTVLLLSWMSARLHWRVLGAVRGQPEQRITGTVGAGNRSIPLTVAPVDAPARGPGGIESVRVTFSGGWHATFTSGSDHGSIETRVEGRSGGPVESVLWVRDRDERAVLAGELEVLVPDRMYEEALHTMDQMVGGVR